MKRVKAKVTIAGETHWVSADSAQELVDRALLCQSCRKDIPLFADYANQYIRLYKANGSIQGNTLIGYRGYLRQHLIPFFGSMLIDQITPNSLQEYINLKSLDYSEKTIREHLQLLGLILESAVEDELILKNPCHSRRLSVVGKPSRKVDAYEEDEWKQLESLLPCMPKNCKLLLGLSLYTGMRQGEIFALRWENVDLKNRVICVAHSVEWVCQNRGALKEPKTGNGFREIPIIPQLQDILEEFYEPNGFVLKGEKCRPNEPMTRQAVKRLNERINHIADLEGVHVRFLSHRARHSLATFLNNFGADDVTITHVMGHSDVNFTKRQYVSSQQSQTKRGMDLFAKSIQTL